MVVYVAHMMSIDLMYAICWIMCVFLFNKNLFVYVDEHFGTFSIHQRTLFRGIAERLNIKSGCNAISWYYND